MNSICYLCNEIIKVDDEKSSDHVVPRLLIDREQPKVKGYDYGGSIKTHKSCNNHFGPEDYGRKALKIISKLNDPDCISTLILDPSIKIMALNSACFEEFTDKELTYFKVRDVRNNTNFEITDPDFIKSEPSTNIREKVLFTTFAVLVKSAAALLIKRSLMQIPSKWKVLAIPYHGATKELNLNRIFGEAKPFDKDVKIYIQDLNAGIYLVLYLAYGVMLYVFIQISENDKYFKEIAAKHPDADCYVFNSNCINDLIDYQWKTLQQ